MRIPDYIKGTLSNALNDSENTHVHLANLAEMLNHWERSVLFDASAPDDPQYDGTDFAHPSWWRGHDHAFQRLCQIVNEILDGKPIEGTCSEPWESTRKRLANTVITMGQLSIAAQASPAGREYYGFEHDPMG